MDSQYKYIKIYLCFPYHLPMARTNLAQCAEAVHFTLYKRRFDSTSQLYSKGRARLTTGGLCKYMILMNAWDLNYFSENDTQLQEANTSPPPLAKMRIGK